MSWSIVLLKYSMITTYHPRSQPTTRTQYSIGIWCSWSNNSLYVHNMHQTNDPGESKYALFNKWVDEDEPVFNYPYSIEIQNHWQLHFQSSQSQNNTTTTITRRCQIIFTSRFLQTLHLQIPKISQQSQTILKTGSINTCSPSSCPWGICNLLTTSRKSGGYLQTTHSRSNYW